MRRLDILLFDRLDCDEAHAGTAHRFADRLGIVRVVLVAFDKRFNELGGDQLDSKSSSFELTRPMMGPSATLHADLTTRFDLFQHRLKPAITW
jgi:hypothetical protein